MKRLRRIPLYVKLFLGHLLFIPFLIITIANGGSHLYKNQKLEALEVELTRVKSMANEVKVLAFGTKADLSRIRSVTVKVTSYNPTPGQGWKSGQETADGSLVAPGMVAVSRDLMSKYKLKFGQRVILKNYGSFIVKDLMHPRKRNQVDIISFIPGWSRKFGTKSGTLYIAQI